MITDNKVNAKYVGAYLIGDDFETSVQFATTFKPNLIRRFFTWLFLGWKWKTIDEIRKLRSK
jgi:hypothetical protein